MFLLKRDITLLLLILFFLLGFLNFTYHGKYLPQKVIQYGAKTTSVKGKVLDVNKYENIQIFTLRGTIGVLVKTKMPLEISPGDIIRLKNVKFRQISQKGYSPYLINYYKRKGIYLHTWVNSSQIELLKHKNSFLRLYRFREKAKEIFKDTPLLGALMLGREFQIPKETKDIFIRAGIIHLFAVSGLHFGIIFFFLLLIFRYWFPRRSSLVLSFVLITLYFFIVGFHPSVVRAYVMISLYVLSKLIWREYDFLSAISFSALFILIINPLELQDPGFLLSFLSVLGIYAFDKMIDKEVIIKPFYLIFLAFWLWALNFPIVVGFFHRVPLLSILFSPFLSIIATGFIIYAFFMFFTSILAPFSSPYLFTFINGFVKIYKDFVELIASFPFSSYIFPAFPWYMILLWYLFIGFVFYTLKAKKYKLFFSSGIVFTGLVLVFLLLPSSLSISFISVGEGDAIFIHSPNSINLLIDAGNLYYGGNKVVEYLKARGVNTLDFVFITHPDVDHWGGLVKVISNFSIKKIFCNGQRTEDKAYIDLMNSIKKRKIPIDIIREGDKIYIGDNLYLNILNPQRDFYFDKDNNNSIVIGLRYGEFSALFTGDLEKDGENYLLSRKLLSHFEILKVAHHGSKSSTDTAFLKMISPVVAIISVGKNRYGHPSKKVVKLLKERGILVFRTDIDGNIRISTYGHSYTIKTDKTHIRRRYELSTGTFLP